MSIIWVILILLCISAGCFAIGAVSGSKLGSAYGNNVTLKTSFVFVVANLISLSLSFIVGKLLQDWYGGLTQWLAFAMLFIIGIRLFWESVERSPSLNYTDIVQSNYLVRVAVQASVDSFMFGFTLALFFGNRIEIFLLALLLSAVFNFFMTILGLSHGHAFPRTVLGKRLELASGAVIVIAAVNMLFKING
jgi:putative Mn2+ efflux pump MntP